MYMCIPCVRCAFKLIKTLRGIRAHTAQIEAILFIYQAKSYLLIKRVVVKRTYFKNISLPEATLNFYKIMKVLP